MNLAFIPKLYEITNGEISLILKKVLLFICVLKKSRLLISKKSISEIVKFEVYELELN